MDPKLQQRMGQEQALHRAMEREAYRLRVEKGERPWEESVGIQSVVDAVRDLMFPKELEDLEREAGDRVVNTSGDHRMPLRQVLRKLKGATFFATIQDFQTAVTEHWEGVEFEELPEEQRPQGAGGKQPPQTRRAGGPGTGS